MLLAVEVESPGSADIDRTTKPREYAEAGIGDYWRVTRRDGSAMVSLHRLGDSERHECWRVLPLDELLADDPAKLLTPTEKA